MSGGKGHKLILLASLSLHAATTAQLQSLVDATQACLAVTVITASLLTDPGQAIAATAVALAVEDMPPAHAVAVLHVSDTALPMAGATPPILVAAPTLLLQSTADAKLAANAATALGGAVLFEMPVTEVSRSARESLISLVSASAAEALGDANEGQSVPNAQEPLMDAGLNSAGAVQLVSLLEASTGLELPGTLAFDYPSVVEIADYLLTLQHPGLNTAGTTPAVATSVATVVPALQNRDHAPAVALKLQHVAASPQVPVVEIINAAVVDIQGLDGAEAQDLSLDSPLMDSGLTSTLAIQLTTQLELLLHKDLPGTLAFDYPTVRDMAAFVASLDDSSATVSSHRQTAAATTAAVSILPSDSQVSEVHSKAAVLQSIVNCLVADVIGEGVDADTPLMDAGLNSAAAIQLTTALEETLAADLPGTLVFDYPTVTSLVTYLTGCDLHLPQGGTSLSTAAAAISPALPGTAPCMITAAATVSTGSHAHLETAVPKAVVAYAVEDRSQAVAIVASAHRVPGGSLQPGTSTNAVDRISPVPLDRWDPTEAALDNPSELNAAFGSFLSNVDQFDPAAFRLSGSEATLMDPQQRLLLETFAEANSAFNASLDRHACDSPGFVRGNNMKQQFGVYVGVSQLEYARITYETGLNLNAYYATGAHLSVTAGRIAYTFALKGPAMAGEMLFVLGVCWPSSLAPSAPTSCACYVSSCTRANHV